LGNLNPAVLGSGNTYY